MSGLHPGKRVGTLCMTLEAASLIEEDDSSSSEEIVADITPPQTELEKHHTKIDMSNFLENDTNQIELNEEFFRP